MAASEENAMRSASGEKQGTGSGGEVWRGDTTSYLVECLSSHDVDELLRRDDSITIEVGAIDHLFQLGLSHRLTELTGNTKKIVQSDGTRIIVIEQTEHLQDIILVITIRLNRERKKRDNQRSESRINRKIVPICMVLSPSFVVVVCCPLFVCVAVARVYGFVVGVGVWCDRTILAVIISRN